MIKKRVKKQTGEKAIFNWSGGKDAALCLYKVLHEGKYDISFLLTTASSRYGRVSHHGVRLELLKDQADSIGIPLSILNLPFQASMKIYESEMRRKMKEFKDLNIHVSIFGDVFLEDLRCWREKKLSAIGFEGVFPLWKENTSCLAEEFIDLGFKAVVVCINNEYLDKNFVGREFNRKFIKDLPEKADPCGEKGEFHTFVYDGPIFQQAISFRKGKKVYREYSGLKKNKIKSNSQKFGFWFCDLKPDNQFQ